HHQISVVARRKGRRQGQGRPHAAHVGRGRVPGDDSGEAEAKLDHAAQAAHGGGPIRRAATVTNSRITFSKLAGVLFIVLLAVIAPRAPPSADAPPPPAPAAPAAPSAGSGDSTGARAGATPASPEAAFLNQYC